jgi:hypothetical protein
VLAGIFFASCEKERKKTIVEPLEGSVCSVFTVKQNGKIRQGILGGDGTVIREAVYERVSSDHGFIVGWYSDKNFDMFFSDGTEFLPLVSKDFYFYDDLTPSDSLVNFCVRTQFNGKSECYLYFPKYDKLVGPRENMFVHSKQGCVVYIDEERLGVLNLDNKELINDADKVCFLSSGDENQRKPSDNAAIIYYRRAGKWYKVSAITGENLGKVSAAEQKNIDFSVRTMIDGVYSLVR